MASVAKRIRYIMAITAATPRRRMNAGVFCSDRIELTSNSCWRMSNGSGCIDSENTSGSESGVRYRPIIEIGRHFDQSGQLQKKRNVRYAKPRVSTSISANILWFYFIIRAGHRHETARADRIGYAGDQLACRGPIDEDWRAGGHGDGRAAGVQGDDAALDGAARAA